MTRGGKRKGAGRPKDDTRAKWTAPLAVRVPPEQLARFKKSARSIGWSFTDFVYSAVYAKADEVEALPADEKKRQRRVEKLFEELDEAIERGDNETIERLDVELNELEPEED